MDGWEQEAECHETVAGSCCLEVALWRTVWTDAVSSALSASMKKGLHEPPGVIAWSALVSIRKGSGVGASVAVELPLFRSFGHETWAGTDC